METTVERNYKANRNVLKLNITWFRMNEICTKITNRTINTRSYKVIESSNGDVFKIETNVKKKQVKNFFNTWQKLYPHDVNEQFLIESLNDHYMK